MAVLGITIETRTFKRHHKPTQVQLHQIMAANWIAEMENSLPKGGLLADNWGTGKFRPSCALDIQLATLTISRLWQRWLLYVTRLMSVNRKLTMHLLDWTCGRLTWTTTKQRLNWVRRSEGSEESLCGRSTSQKTFYGITWRHTITPTAI